MGLSQWGDAVLTALPLYPTKLLFIMFVDEFAFTASRSQVKSYFSDIRDRDVWG